MNRNKDALTSRAHICSAVLTLYEITKLLRLARADFERMFTEDVTRYISSDRPNLHAYAEGLRDAYLTAIIKDHCEFVYSIEGQRFTPAEAVQQGGRATGVCGYQWKDSEIDFTPFSKEVDLWV